MTLTYDTGCMHLNFHSNSYCWEADYLFLLLTLNEMKLNRSHTTRRRSKMIFVRTWQWYQKPPAASLCFAKLHFPSLSLRISTFTILLIPLSPSAFTPSFISSLSVSSGADRQEREPGLGERMWQRALSKRWGDSTHTESLWVYVSAYNLFLIPFNFPLSRLRLSYFFFPKAHITVNVPKWKDTQHHGAQHYCPNTLTCPYSSILQTFFPQ